MSRLDALFYRRFWPAPAVAVREGPSTSPEPAPESAPVRPSPTLDTTYEATRQEVAAEELAVANRLAELVEGGLSPLEAARRLFIPTDIRSES